jgi:hypothetical protein
MPRSHPLEVELGKTLMNKPKGMFLARPKRAKGIRKR